MATCLSQLYHEHRRGLKPGYAKFETFPDLEPPAQAPGQRGLRGGHGRHRRLQPGRSLPPRGLRQGRRQLQPRRRGLPGPAAHHREDHRRPVLLPVADGHGRATRAGFGIVGRRGLPRGRPAGAHPPLLPLFLRIHAGLRREGDRPAGRAPDEGARASSPRTGRVVGPARRAAEEARAAGKGNKGVFVGAAMELRDGTIVTGKNSPLMHAASGPGPQRGQDAGRDPGHDPSALALDRRSRSASSRRDVFGAKSVSLDLSEVLICLSINAAANPMAHSALEKMKELQGAEVHITHIPTPGDDGGLRRFGINLTTDPHFASHHLAVG
ncbi:MAG: DUF1846 domain-containing protein [Desulfomicrobium escambiense]|nr:DUF1846 domain-containing protein [Desulfomicrobium escambiense]